MRKDSRILCSTRIAECIYVRRELLSVYMAQWFLDENANARLVRDRAPSLLLSTRPSLVAAVEDAEVTRRRRRTSRPRVMQFWSLGAVVGPGPIAIPVKNQK